MIFTQALYGPARYGASTRFATMPFVIAVDDRAEQRLAVRFNVLDDLHAWTSLDVSVEQRAPLK